MLINYDVVKEMRNEGKSYRKIWEELNLPIKYFTFEKSAIKFMKTGERRESKSINNEYRFRPMVEEFKQEEMTLYPCKSVEEALQLLEKGCRLSDICQDPIVSIDMLDELMSAGYCIDLENGLYILSKNPKKKTRTIRREWEGNKHIRIGVVSDTHIGSVYNQMTFLNHLYDRYKDLGITDVYHCGDISDGWYPNRSDQVYELHAHGADRQVDYICNNYPKIDGITTHFVIGNHDYTFIRNTGFNIGPAIESKRPDMKYLGINNARVWITPKCDIEINHPGDGSAYAMSYSIQKYIDSMSGGDKPKILLNGHHHKYLSLFYRNIHAIEVPCTEAQTSFMKSKRLAAHMGGLVLDIYVDDEGTIDRLSVELIPLYKAEENDY